MNTTMPSNHHIFIHIMPNSPKTNSSKRFDEKRGRVAWPVEEIRQKEAKTKNMDSYASFLSLAHTNPTLITTFAKLKYRLENTNNINKCA